VNTRTATSPTGIDRNAAEDTTDEAVHGKFRGFAYKRQIVVVVMERNTQGRWAVGSVRSCGANSSRCNNEVMTNCGESAGEEPPERRVSAIMHERGGVLLFNGRVASAMRLVLDKSLPDKFEEE
jgi:hypothetical protein